MQATESLLHKLDSSADGISLPSAFTYPFHYSPHPLVRIAATQVQNYLKTRTDWHEELEKGKMFGVLIVCTSQQSVGFLAAFSGNLAGSNRHDYFVPPIYDLLQPDGFFREEEANISRINHQIACLKASAAYQTAYTHYEESKQQMLSQLDSLKDKMKEAKARREELRTQGISPETAERLIKESQFQKAEYKRTERKLKLDVEQKRSIVEQLESQITAWKKERKTRSAALQRKLFEQFNILNAYGESKNVYDIFLETTHSIPPAGTGECALPKLLQYAYLHHLKPVAMGEFWWGQSPKDEIRIEGNFYPSCQQKCAPILRHALMGLNVEKNSLAEDTHRHTPLPIVYEDEWIVAVNKPAGMLSVPGKENLDSVWERLRIMYPHATGPLVVHRLDMATSGILLAAKDKDTHQLLQEQFASRKVKKTYTAIIEGIVEQNEGRIELPLCANPADRPRQMVNHEHGKKAVTLYKVLKRANGKTLLLFFPQTGRTHQLRMHAAHPEGLSHPICGDSLYGKHADRLYLHASELRFTHPVTKKQICICCKANFSL